MAERALRRTHCATCGVELTESTGARKSSRYRGWHAECKACRSITRRATHDESEAEQRFMLTRDVCDICGQPERSRRNGVVKLLAKDHDHRTGAWRGLLCERCNQAIGLFSDNVELLQSAIRYLNDPPGLLLLEPEK